MEVGVVGTGLTREVAGEEGDLVMRMVRMMRRRMPPT